jgi:hypothetical protein
LSDEEVRQLLEALNNPRQPPLLTAIYGASIVEHEVENLIRPRLGRDDPNTWSSLTNDTGPLGIFHAKIVMGYALWAFDASVRRNLDIVRRIRNAFAHTRTPYLDFDDEIIRTELRKIISIPRASNASKEVLAEAQRVIETDGSVAYINLCVSLFFWLYAR